MVLYNGTLYECSTAITTAEAWTAAHWTAVKVGPEITDLKNAFESYVYGLNKSFAVNTASKIYTFPMFFVKGKLYTITNNTSAACTIDVYKSDGTKTALSSNLAAGASVTFTPSSDDYVSVSGWMNGTGSINVVCEYSNLDDIASKAEKTYVDNLVGNVPTSKKDGYYIDSTGAETVNAIYDLYLVSLIPGTSVAIHVANASNGVAYCGFFDTSGNIIGTLFRNDESGVFDFVSTIEVPAGANVLKLSHRNNVGVSVSVSVVNAIKGITKTFDTMYVNAKTFGAKGDGATDDTTALQSAITYCQNNHCALRIPAGTYKITDALTITESQMKIEGDGWGTVIKQTGSGKDVIQILGTQNMRVDGCYIAHLTLMGDYNWNGTIGSGGATTGNGLYIEHADTCIFENVRFYRNGTNGFLIGARVWACVFNDCQFAQNKVNGFDGGDIVEETKYRTASTLNFKSCYFYHNQIGIHWQGNQLIMYGGWIEVNNHGIEIYPDASSANLSMYGTDIEGNILTSLNIKSPINGLKMIGGSLYHSGSWSAILFAAAGNYQNIVLDSLISISGSQYLVEAYSGAYVYVRGIPSKYIGSNQGAFRFGSGSVSIERDVRFDDILSHILDYSDGVVVIPPNSGVTVKINEASRITKISFTHTDNLPIVYRTGINGSLQRANTELVGEKRELSVQATNFIMIINSTSSNVRITDAVITYLT